MLFAFSGLTLKTGFSGAVLTAPGWARDGSPAGAETGVALALTGAPGRHAAGHHPGLVAPLHPPPPCSTSTGLSRPI
jgi:hypothetical protein